MTRRKQNCPKRMKWEGAEGEQPPEGVEEEGAPSEEEEEEEEGGDQEGDSQVSSQPPSPGSPLLTHESENALILRESASPSRDSRGSSLPRCGSRESAASDRADVLSLMPPAVMLGAASARLGSVSPLVAPNSSSPPMLLPSNCLTSSPRSSPLQSPIDASDMSAAVLDFSTKRSSSQDAPVLNLSKASTPALSPVETHLNSPLDLSVSSRKRSHDDSPTTSSSPSPTPRKTPRVTPADFKSVVSPWTSPAIASHFPYFVAAVANSLSPKNNTHTDSSLWNGKMAKLNDKSPSNFGLGPMPSDATKALEKMSELSKLGGDEFKPMGNSVLAGGAGGRHSAWQSHWQNKGADQAKDVLKCVWCKQSFPSLAAMTVHMKEAKHCGVNVPVPPIQPPPPPIPQSSQNSSSSSSNSLSGSQGGPNSKPSASDLNLLIKETMPLPRKLVRGQDVWLGKGAEQTRQILKCMWCGQSFRSLAEMTSHMQQTQHYTNIISQEQIISWKSADEGKSGSQGGGGAGGSSGSAVGAAGSGGGPGATSSHVSAVLTCKVCDQAFSSLKELSNHMVKNSHYKEHIMRSITESGGRRRQTREKRKKSLPVRKLLELERAQNELKNGEGIMLMGNKPGRELHSAGRITCEKCGEKIDMAVFVDHIRLCIGGGHIGSDQRNLLKNALLSSNILPPESQMTNVTQALQESRKIKRDEQQLRQQQSPSSATDLSMPPSSPKEMATKQEGKSSSPSVLNAIEKLIEKSFDSRSRHGAGYPGAMGSPGQGPIGSSILKRLGIDESVDYTKPLVDPQTMNLLRSYHHHHASQYARRERSGSESSSISERGRNDSLTPDRKFDSSDRLMSSTRTTPEKRIQTPPSAKMSSGHESNDEEIHIKKEIDDNESVKDDDGNGLRNDVHVKKEDGENGDDEDDRRSFQSDEPLSQMRLKEEPQKESPDRSMEDLNDEDRKSGGGRSPSLSPRQPTPGRPSSSDPVANSPCRNSASPASSDRSGTPRSTDRKASGSLGALSSMFDSLSGGGGGANCQGEPQAGTAVKGTSHPLAALQKLCDKTETHHHQGGGSGSRSSSAVPMNPGLAGTQGSSSSTSVAGATPGGILALSWACNEAVVTADSIMKCAFCDTPFISKGAYRHHLSKMHFLKDGVIPDPVALKSQAGSAQQTAQVASSKSSGSNGNNAASTSSSAKSPPAQTNNYEESPHSKFLKYTELAKQLSSKYV